jgi:hypothetical protein
MSLASRETLEIKERAWSRNDRQHRPSMGSTAGGMRGTGRSAVCERVNVPKPEASCNARADVKVKGRSCLLTTKRAPGCTCRRLRAKPKAPPSRTLASAALFEKCATNTAECYASPSLFTMSLAARQVVDRIFARRLPKIEVDCPPGSWQGSPFAAC